MKISSIILAIDYRYILTIIDKIIVDKTLKTFAIGRFFLGEAHLSRDETAYLPVELYCSNILQYFLQNIKITIFQNYWKYCCNIVEVQQYIVV